MNGKKAKELILYYSKKKVGRKLPSLGLLNLRYLTPEAAQILASYDSGISIPWSALKNNPKTLKNLLYCEHGIIFLKVGSLDEEMVKICQEAKSCFSLHEVTAISPVAAQSLMRCKNLALISIKDDPGLTPILEMLAPLKSKILLFPRKY